MNFLNYCNASYFAYHPINLVMEIPLTPQMRKFKRLQIVNFNLTIVSKNRFCNNFKILKAKLLKLISLEDKLLKTEKIKGKQC